MKKQLLVLWAFAVAMSLLMSCTKENVSEFEMENAPYTANFSFVTKNQTFVPNSKDIQVIIEGKGNYSFSGQGTFTDTFVLSLATGVGTHTMVFTDANGDKINATMTTQIGATNITGTTNIMSGTGRYAKIKGESKNQGPLLNAKGEGSWEESGSISF